MPRKSRESGEEHLINPGEKENNPENHENHSENESREPQHEDSAFEIQEKKVHELLSLVKQVERPHSLHRRPKKEKKEAPKTSDDFLALQKEMTEKLEQFEALQSEFLKEIEKNISLMWKTEQDDEHKFQVMEECAINISKLLFQIEELESDAKVLFERIYEVNDNFRTTFVRENGFDYYDQLRNAAESCSKKLYELTLQNPISKWLSRKEIAKLRAEQERLSNLRSKANTSASVPYIREVDSQYKRESLKRDTIEAIVRFVIDHYKNGLETNKENEPVDPKIIRDIQKQLIASKLKGPLEEAKKMAIEYSYKDPNDPEFEFSDKHIAEALELAELAVENEYRSSVWGMNEFSQRVQALPNGPKETTARFITQYNGETNQKRLQNFFDVCTQLDDIIQQQKIRSSFSQTLERADTVISEYHLQRKISKEKDALSESPSPVDTLLKNFDRDQWKLFIQNPEIRATLGEEKIERINSYLARTFAEKLIESNDNRDMRVECGKNQYAFTDESSIPLIILNAHVEYGHYGSEIFLPTTRGSKESDLNNYIFALTKENYEKIKALNIPGLEEYIDILKSHPDTYYVKSFYQPTTNSYIENPIYQKSQEALAKMIQHFLAKGDRLSQFFATKTFAKCTADLGTTYQSVEKILTNTNDTALKRDLIQNLIERHRFMGDKKALLLLAKNIPSLDNDSIIFLKKQFPQIIGQFIDSRYSQKIISEEEMNGLASISDSTPETVRSLLRFLSYLETSDNYSYDTNTNQATLEQYLAIANNEEAVSLVKRLNSFGYKFKNEDAHQIVSLSTDPAAIANIDRIGNCIDQKFSKIKGAPNFFLWRQSFENPNLIADILEELPSEVSMEMETFITYGKMFVSFTPEKRQEAYSNLAKILESPNAEIRSQKRYLLPKTSTEPEFIDGKFIAPVERTPEEIYVESKDVLEILKGMPDAIVVDKKLFDIFIRHKKRFLEFSPEKRAVGYTLIEKVFRSFSQEIQRLSEEIFLELLQVDDPEKAFAEVENVFVKNNLPLIGKIYKVFEILHPPQVLAEKLRKDSSPVLINATEKKRSLIIYNDLLRIHLESGNRSLKQYLEFLHEGEKVFAKIEEVGEEALSPREKKMALALVKKIQTLSENAELGTNTTSPEISASLNDEIKKLKAQLGVKKGQTLNGRILEIFAQPLGFESIDEALQYMNGKKNTANERNRALAERQKEKVKDKEDKAIYFELSPNDLLKGVDVTYISQILQNGSVAKEFLGASSNSDYTPLDTDTSRVLSEDLDGGFATGYQRSIASSYGNLCFALKDRGQFELTTPETPKQKNKSKLELFSTPVLGKRHYGIRTGFPSTEIDFMIAKDEFIKDAKQLQFLYTEIAKNGFYIPVVDTTGKLLFTPEMFDAHRKAFDGLDVFDGKELSFLPTTPEDPHYEEVTKLRTEMKEDQKHLERLLEDIRHVVQETLSEFGIVLKDEFESSITDAEFYDTGSTGRGTFTPGSYDFDYTLKLAERDIPKIPLIVKAIQAKLNPDANYSNSHADENGYYQFRADKVTLGKDTDLAIDIGFGRKNALSEFSSHDAINGKLKNIEETHGKEARKDVVANIVLTKQILKEAGIYKKLDKGLGGIGVETWILQHGGNMTKAFKAFYDAAHYEGVALPFDEFKKRYSILDAGINIKHLNYDNFVYHLSDETYHKMLRTLEKYTK